MLAVSVLSLLKDIHVFIHMQTHTSLLVFLLKFLLFVGIF